MLSKFVKPGCKIELQAVNKVNGTTEEKQKVYRSQVHDIISEDRMEITMPMEQTKLILLPVDGEYDAVFYGNSNLYQCFLRIIDRYKSNNVYILVVEMTSNLRKYQRREYYRFSCALEMCARPLVEEEVKAIEQKEAYLLTPGLPLKRSVIVDISGGGLRFMSNQRYEPESLIYCTYHLLIDGKNRECEIIGKILSVKEVESRKGTFEHRVQYVNLGVNEREEIIKYIFEEERKSRRREKGL
ncbi:MAG: flagellar brake protein [Lachnospiraceae bacterium]